MTAHSTPSASENLPLLLTLAVALGVLGDILLRGVPWGINVSLWTIAVAASTAVTLLRVKVDAARSTASLLVTAVVFSACVAWRDADVLTAWNVLAIVLALGLALLRGRRFALGRSTIGAYIRDGVAAGVRLLIVPFTLIGASGSSAQPGPVRSPPARKILIGLLLSVPILLVFGALLASADPIFERTIRWLIDWDFEQLASHALLTGVLTWLTAGLLLTISASGPLWPFGDRTWRTPALGVLEVGIPLTALALLFGLFVGIQFRYLFGGEDLIRATVDLTYAEYARRGFFELVTATALVVPLLVAGDTVLQTADAASRRRFRWLATLLLALVALIMVSALERLRLYVGAYGLTDTRVYAATVMLWVGLVLAWFGGTVLRGHREHFVLGGLVAGFVVLALLNVANPEALVARTNLRRAAAGAELDIDYFARLGADAMPALHQEASRLSQDQRCLIVQHLSERQIDANAPDWRTWNLARHRAGRIGDGLTSAGRGCQSPAPNASNAAVTPS